MLNSSSMVLTPVTLPRVGRGWKVAACRNCSARLGPYDMRSPASTASTRLAIVWSRCSLARLARSLADPGRRGGVSQRGSTPPARCLTIVLNARSRSLTLRIFYREHLHFERNAPQPPRVASEPRRLRIARKSQGRDARKMRDELFQEFQPLPGHLADDRGVPVMFPPWSSETVHEPRPHWINRMLVITMGMVLVALFCGQYCWRAGCEHDVELERAKDLHGVRAPLLAQERGVQRPGLRRPAGDRDPNSWSEPTNCNAHLRQVAEGVKRGRTRLSSSVTYQGPGSIDNPRPAAGGRRFPVPAPAAK